MAKNDKLESLFDIPLQIYAKYGYKKTTVENVSSRPGTTNGIIYFYVKIKEDIRRML